MTEASTDSRTNAIRRLEQAVKSLGASAGTAHRLSGDGLTLRLVWSSGLPTHVLQSIEGIPKGKGLAGQAWSTQRMVETCNLASDERVGAQARSLSYGSTFAIPIKVNGIFMGVLGVAFQEKHVMTAIEIEQLSKRFTELILTYS